MPIEPHRAPVEHRLRAAWGPAHPRLFHAIFHEVPTGAFHHTRPNRPTACQVRIIAHVRPVPSVVAHRPLDRLPWRHGARGVFPLGLQRRDDGVSLSR
jgi:hypothetical protein